MTRHITTESHLALISNASIASICFIGSILKHEQSLLHASTAAYPFRDEAVEADQAED
jgi:hypothetical protein